MSELIVRTLDASANTFAVSSQIPAGLDLLGSTIALAGAAPAAASNVRAARAVRRASGGGRHSRHSTRQRLDLGAQSGRAQAVGAAAVYELHHAHDRIAARPCKIKLTLQFANLELQLLALFGIGAGQFLAVSVELVLDVFDLLVEPGLQLMQGLVLRQRRVLLAVRCTVRCDGCCL